MNKQYTEEEMTSVVFKWLLNESVENQKSFVECDYNDLIVYHNTLGRNIRNHFNIWKNTWEPKIINGFDHAEDHPDQISMRIIQNVWRRSQTEITEEDVQ
jgi:hypothetical protein